MELNAANDLLNPDIFRLNPATRILPTVSGSLLR